MPKKKQDTLEFRITPEILEDLGVNLYTSLSKALVEFVANAHDADAKKAQIKLDITAIRSAAAQAIAKAKTTEGAKEVLLPDAQIIVIEDDGHGMDRADLEKKFLLVGRRRRRDDKRSETPNRRIVMGRKGLGKLAGFGIAHRVEVVSKRKQDNYANRILLNYDDIIRKGASKSVRVPYEKVPGSAGFRDGHGTRVTLSRLVGASFEDLPADVVSEVADYFWMVAIADFRIEHGGKVIAPAQKPIDSSYPRDPKLSPAGLVTVTRSFRGLGETAFSYRIHFTGPKEYLRENERGLRIYAHNRLASPPSLLEIKTSTNGYQYTSYMHGVVIADFIDDQPRDYISTDRQGLRWDTPALAELREFLREEIKQALDEHSRKHVRRVSDEVAKDKFTKSVVGSARLPAHRKRSAMRVATTLAKFHPDGVKSTIYRKALPGVVRGLGQGEILAAIAELAKQDHPDFKAVAREISELAKQEYDDFVQFVKSRLEGIEALRKICERQDFRKAKNEKELQRLFERSSWLIDATFFQFLTADHQQNVVNRKLAEHLEVARSTPKGYNPNTPDEAKAFGANKRPDLVFLLNNEKLQRVVVVELKAPNVPLHHDHLVQLEGYMRRTEEWLRTHYPKIPHVVEGNLIGSRAVAAEARNDKVRALADAEEKRGDKQNWRVFDILEVLQRAKDAHAEMIDVAQRAAQMITEQQEEARRRESDEAAADADPAG